MGTTLNTFVDFVGDFPWPQSVYDVPGKEVAELLASGLRTRGIEVAGIDGRAPEIGHYIDCVCRERRFSVCVTVDDWENPGRWQLLTSPSRETRAKTGVIDALEQLLVAINETLRDCDGIEDIRWFPFYEQPDYLAIQSPSGGPVRDPSVEGELPRVIRVDLFLENLSYRLCSLVGFILLCSGIVLVGTIAPAWGMVLALIWFVACLLSGLVLPGFISIYISFLARRQASHRRPTTHGR